jgi:hypothetical protein
MDDHPANIDAQVDEVLLAPAVDVNIAANAVQDHLAAVDVNITVNDFQELLAAVNVDIAVNDVQDFEATAPVDKDQVEDDLSVDRHLPVKKIMPKRKHKFGKGAKRGGN